MKSTSGRGRATSKISSTSGPNLVAFYAGMKVYRSVNDGYSTDLRLSNPCKGI